ncbi:Rieske (2Fe-2S) protein [Nocardioides alcanivorans]|uniref:Rieske (2Fe-2S) protein n=1 Tax=Nocardioides alcanivorans TaxID=2897352 RepID=UPI001F1A8A18|nr:Rieske (2Fe-2S) protein [Nocardioides alcanivorans]
MTDSRPLISRRTTFKGMGALGAALVLAACSGGDDAPSAPEAESGDVLASTSEVPVGGGVILADRGIVITQPTEGEFAAFSAVCTHQRATLSDVDADGIHCPRHGSVFDATDGSVVNGPASSGLPEVAITVEDGNILAA